MNLTHIRIDGSHGPATVDFGAGPVTAVMGPTGSGKTSLLHLVHRTRELCAPFGTVRPSLTSYAAPPSPGVRVTLRLAFDEQERERFGIGAEEEVEAIQPLEGSASSDVSPAAAAALGAYGHRGEQGFFELIPSARTEGYTFSEMGESAQKRARALEASKYPWVESFFADVALGVAIGGRPAPDILEVNGALDAMACPLRLDHARRVGATHAPVFALSGALRVGLGELPAGCRQAALFVALVTLLQPRRCVFLVDDLERDLDADMQVGVLDLLRRGQNQVIFSTRSLALARSTAVTTVIKLERAVGA